MDDHEARGALLGVRLAMAQAFERDGIDWRETRLCREEPWEVVEHSAGYAFAYPGVVYGIDVERGAVWEDTDVPGVDAGRVFDLCGRDLYAERARLLELVDRLERSRRQ